MKRKRGGAGVRGNQFFCQQVKRDDSAVGCTDNDPNICWHGWEIQTPQLRHESDRHEQRERQAKPQTENAEEYRQHEQVGAGEFALGLVAELKESLDELTFMSVSVERGGRGSFGDEFGEWTKA